MEEGGFCDWWIGGLHCIALGCGLEMWCGCGCGCGWENNGWRVGPSDGYEQSCYLAEKAVGAREGGAEYLLTTFSPYGRLAGWLAFY